MCKQRSISHRGSGYVHTNPDKFENATFSLDRPTVHTKPDNLKTAFLLQKKKNR